MTCAECQDQLLECDPAELSQSPGSPLAAHLSGCEACRELAQRLDRAQADARSHYLALEPRHAAIIPNQRHVDANRSLRPRYALVGLGIAAALAIVLWRGNVGTPAEGSGAPALSPATITPTSLSTPVVAVAPSQNAVVFPTRDSLISVVWIY